MKRGDGALAAMTDCQLLEKLTTDGFEEDDEEDFSSSSVES
jgi:hypothetical protein